MIFLIFSIFWYFRKYHDIFQPWCFVTTMKLPHVLHIYSTVSLKKCTWLHFSRKSSNQLSVIKFIQRAQTSSLNAIRGATRQGASCPCGGESSVSWDLTWRTKLYYIDAARVVTGSKLVVSYRKATQTQWSISTRNG